MKIRELTPEQEAAWTEWVESRPPVIRDVARRFKPNHLYRLETTGQRVELVAFAENGTVRIDVPGEYNPRRTVVDMNVFGVDPNKLEELGEEEREVIAREVEEMKPLADLRDATREALWTPQGIEAMRVAIGLKKSSGDAT